MITNEELKQFRVQFKALEKDIKEYSTIVIYRHKSPDFDALGAQMGLYRWIRLNYPDKEVHYVGDRHPDLMPDLFPIQKIWMRPSIKKASCHCCRCIESFKNRS